MRKANHIIYALRHALCAMLIHPADRGLRPSAALSGATNIKHSRDQNPRRGYCDNRAGIAPKVMTYVGIKLRQEGKKMNDE